MTGSEEMTRGSQEGAEAQVEGRTESYKRAESQRGNWQIKRSQCLEVSEQRGTTRGRKRKLE